MKNILKTAALVALPALALSSCNFLDVAPARTADLTDAMKDKNMVENWIFGCYSFVPNLNTAGYRNFEGTTDEFVYPDAWGSSQHYDSYYVSRGLMNASNVPASKWQETYGAIGNVHLFLRELENQNPYFLTEDDKELYRAHAHFLKGFYYMRLLELFGPVPIVNEYMPTDTPISEFPGRSHFDYCVDYICNELDAASASPQFQSGYLLNDTYGRGNKTICAALKSRLLVYAASPLWNGSFPFPEWRNTNYQTPGYGYELVSHTFDLEKWRRAKTATEEAIQIALENGRELMDLDDLEVIKNMHQDVDYYSAWIPGIDNESEEGKEFLDRMFLMRYIANSDETQGNKELIFTAFNGDGHTKTWDYFNASMPRNVILKNDNVMWHGWCGISPTLQMVESFYTADGHLPEMVAGTDEFPAEEEWLKSAGIPDREMIINLNVGREPRFYAWVLFDGADLGPVLVDGSPLRIDFRNPDKAGFKNDPSDENQCQTGYLAQKYIAPHTRFSAQTQNYEQYPLAMIRMAELYLNLAECCAVLYLNGEAGELQNALDALNKIRARAGVPELTEADCTDDMTILDWVKAERRIELFMEGRRYYDLRRWCEAEQYLKAGARTGLDSFVSRIENPTIEQFNQEKPVDGDYAWYNRMYLLPVLQTEIYNDPQLVQAPGY